MKTIEVYVWGCPEGSLVGLAQDTGVLDDDLALHLARGRALPLNGLHDVEALNDLTEDDVVTVKPWRRDGGDEELEVSMKKVS